MAGGRRCGFDALLKGDEEVDTSEQHDERVLLIRYLYDLLSYHGVWVRSLKFGFRSSYYE
jgi:hypothetical protein